MTDSSGRTVRADCTRVRGHGESKQPECMDTETYEADKGMHRTSKPSRFVFVVTICEWTMILNCCQKVEKLAKMLFEVGSPLQGDVESE